MGEPGRAVVATATESMTSTGIQVFSIDKTTFFPYTALLLNGAYMAEKPVGVTEMMERLSGGTK
jgi:hypothetical protein